MSISDWSSDVCSSDLTGMSTLLGGWGCAVATAAGFEEAVAAFADGEAPDVILVDYHLDDGETGDAVIERLHGHFGRAGPSVMLSAEDRKSVVSGKSVSVRGDLGGSRSMKKQDCVSRPQCAT